MEIGDFKRLTQTIKNKIFLMVGRAILAAVNNTDSTQMVQLELLDGEVVTDIERMQEYGFETFPEPGAEAVPLFVNGNRDQGVVLVIHDRRYRPTTLKEGEVMIYTKWKDIGAGHDVQLLEGRKIVINADEITINADTQLTINCPSVDFNP
ncbi:MAG: phage baseplate assembly protein V [Desulforudis sp.]|nr:MAG: phage baseplate assembly protein V [Desulforudis sp.]